MWGWWLHLSESRLVFHFHSGLMPLLSASGIFQIRRGKCWICPKLDEIMCRSLDIHRTTCVFSRLLWMEAFIWGRSKKMWEKQRTRQWKKRVATDSFHTFHPDSSHSANRCNVSWLTFCVFFWASHWIPWTFVVAIFLESRGCSMTEAKHCLVFQQIEQRDTNVLWKYTET